VYRDDKNHEPLTDRYGFMYDVSQYDVLLLTRAKECGNTAPACLTGVKIADREENNNWPQDEGDTIHDYTIDIVKGPCDCDGEGGKPGQRSREVSPASSRHQPAVMDRSPAIPRVHSSSSILSVDVLTPRHGCANTIRKLLRELTEIHDLNQRSQRKEWDAFVKRRSKVRSIKASSVTASVASGGAGPAAILGLGTAVEEDELSHSEGLIGFAQLGLTSDREERREFDRLVRSGIPLVYRSKVWLECSGGLEMKEPGLFQDLLSQNDGPDSAVAEIEKDVGRTMPLNVFFGGDGPGVDKLRRILIAYSRYVFVPLTFYLNNLNHT
jgi:hypothetical protein